MEPALARKKGDSLVDTAFTRATREAGLRRLFLTQLQAIADNVVVVSDSLAIPDSSGIRGIELALPGKEKPLPIGFRIPSAEALSGAGIPPDLGLSFARLEFAFGGKGRFGFAALTPLPVIVKTSGLTLDITGDYLLWDYRSSKSIAHGRFALKAPYQNFQEVPDWKGAAEAAVKYAVRYSPLKGQKLKEADGLVTGLGK